MKKKEAKLIRITIDMPPELHKKLKIYVAKKERGIRDLILELIERETKSKD